ncbi:MAG: hypothetical protein ACTHLZ_11405 [Tepidisphaeraceae bacterium]
MNIRETLNKHSKAATIVMALFVVGMAAVIYWQANGPSGPTITAKAWYTDDDGKTWFADNIYKPTPFDHNGKPAVWAAVFKCQDKTFVPFVTRLSPTFLKEAQALEAKNDPDYGVKFEALQRQGTEIRKVGDTKWVSADSSTGQALVAQGMKCPDGSTMVPIMP